MCSLCSELLEFSRRHHWLRRTQEPSNRIAQVWDRKVWEASLLCVRNFGHGSHGARILRSWRAVTLRVRFERDAAATTARTSLYHSESPHIEFVYTRLPSCHVGND